MPRSSLPSTSCSWRIRWPCTRMKDPSSPITVGGFQIIGVLGRLLALTNLATFHSVPVADFDGSFRWRISRALAVL